jgi:hypothetical protein
MSIREQSTASQVTANGLAALALKYVRASLVTSIYWTPEPFLRRNDKWIREECVGMKKTS